MMALRRVWTAVAAGALLVVPALGCSNTPEGKVANVQQGDMPSGAKWDGVYYSELYGHLHLKTSGGKVTGRWERPHKDKWGEVEGEANGDVLKFTWSEWNRGLVGPNAKQSGKGYFKYKRPAGEKVIDEIVGEIGLGQDEAGEPWEAKLQERATPDLASIGGTSAMDVGGGDWDKDNKESGKPEPPKGPR